MRDSVMRLQSAQITPSNPSVRAQESGEDLPIEPECHLLDPLALQLEPDGHAIGRHDRRDAVGDHPAERLEVVLEHSSRVVLLAAIREVRVLTVSLRAARREVLGHAGDAVRGPNAPPPSNPSTYATPSSRHLLGILPERAVLARPSRLRRDIECRVQGRRMPIASVLAARDVGELAHGHLVSEGTETQRLGPRRECIGAEGRTPVLGERVPRICRDRHGDAVRRLLGQALQLVAPPRHRTRIRDAVHVEMRDEAVRR